MSDAAQTTSSTQTTQAGSPSTAAQLGDQTPRTLYSAGLKFGQDDPVPDYLKGKSAKEIVDIVETLRTAALNAQPPQPGYQTNYQAPQQAPSSFQGVQPPDPQLMYSDPATYQQQMLAYQDHVLNSRMQQAAQPLMNNMAESAKWQSQSDQKYAKVWQRWGYEIEAQMSTIPQHLRTKQMWDTAAKLVKSEHLDELSNERVEELRTQGGFGTERTGAAGAPVGGPGIDPLGELMADGENATVKQWKAAGMTRSDIESYCKSTGRSVEQYVKDIRGEQTFSAGAN